ncbi:MAG: hypothetical protein IKH31_02290 [Clostridia bacterium]|jgi:hypothetical protein|nr:hypothetical protein [Clostridia bacterium]MBQ4447498.1 hypothetical protein [Clostridia bacterium]MBR3486391.1 hypothetical protein [Clostridia bacterium]
MTASKPAPRKRGRKTKETKRLLELSAEALDCLGAIMNDSSAKASDRLAAVKLTLELAERKLDKHEADDGLIRVVFEGAPAEWSE